MTAEPEPEDLYATELVVDLDALRDNLRAIRARVGDERQVLLAVKADGYGHGAVPIARAAAGAGLVDWFGVATVPEALELRAAGIELPILKLSSARPGAELDAAVGAGIALTVTSVAGARALQESAARLGTRAVAHLKVDTGMRRIGVAPDQAAALALVLERECPDVDLQGLFTHLPVADTAAEDVFTRDQLARFAAVVDDVQAAIGRRIELVHAANSGGVLAHEQSWFDLVRPGIMVYGYYPDPSTPRTVPLRPLITWRSRLTQVKPVRAGESVGYGRTWVAPRDTVVGTVPVGYADGYNRLLSNRGRVLVGGRSCPVVGRVCMDQTMVDLGPDGPDAVGDEVVLIGRQGGEEISTDELAELLGTITYEITCRIDRRVPRVYLGGP